MCPIVVEILPDREAVCALLTWRLPLGFQGVREGRQMTSHSFRFGDGHLAREIPSTVALIGGPFAVGGGYTNLGVRQIPLFAGASSTF